MERILLDLWLKKIFVSICVPSWMSSLWPPVAARQADFTVNWPTAWGSGETTKSSSENWAVAIKWHYFAWPQLSLTLSHCITAHNLQGVVIFIFFAQKGRTGNAIVSPLLLRKIDYYKNDQRGHAHNSIILYREFMMKYRWMSILCSLFSDAMLIHSLEDLMKCAWFALNDYTLLFGLFLPPTAQYTVH